MVCRRSVVSIVLSHVPQLELISRDKHARKTHCSANHLFGIVLLSKLPAVLRYAVRTCSNRSDPMKSLGHTFSDKLKILIVHVATNIPS
jgi:hypothetical protein